MAARPYVPVLKGKEGEYSALEALSPGVKDSIIPLIEIPEITFDYVKERPVRSVDEHIRNAADRITTAWGGRRVFVDLPDAVVGGEGEAESHPLEALVGGLSGSGVHVIPVTGLRRTESARTAAGRAALLAARGVCIRLEPDDFDEERDLDEELGSLLTAAGVTASEADLIVDFGPFGETADPQLLLSTRGAINMVTDVTMYRSLTLIGSSFPENLSDVDATSIRKLPRREWHLWQSLRRRPDRIDRFPDFGDYAVSHPHPPEIDPRVMRMSASIRYTTDQDWLIVKGKNVRDHGYGQFNLLSAELVRQPEFSGDAFSWGDDFIARCARNEAGPGNATTWRKVATNHHLTMVVTQLATLPAL